MPLEFPEEASGFGAWKTFVLAAGLADGVSRTVTAPIDRLKTQLQVSSTNRCHCIREMKHVHIVLIGFSNLPGAAVSSEVVKSSLSCALSLQIHC